MYDYKLDPNDVPESEKPKNLDDFICKICFFLLQDPHECENCGTPYCKTCLEAWHQRLGQCPLRCGATLKIKPAHRFVKKMLSDIKVKCPNENCPEIIFYGSMDSHIDQCLYVVVKCKYEECQEMLKRGELQEHVKNCKFKELQCEKCLEKVKFNEICIQHDCIRTLSEKMRSTNTMLENINKKVEFYEKEILELKNKTNLMMSNISYKCDLGHSLTFKATWTSTCSCCGLIKICTRWECNLCKKNYCLDCIRLINSVFCPNFHTFLYGDRGGFLCDICGAKKTKGGPLSLHDPVCDFDLCENCVIKLFPNLSK